jgi:hypothetical protein
MTSSAVLAYGTGQRGGLDQVLENLHPPLAGVNDWLQNARRAGLRIMVVGDRAWSQLYGGSLAAFRPDPEGVGIDFDFNRQTFENAGLLQQAAPDVLIAHFVTPDHQGHAYGVKSPRYAEHIRDFDSRLFDWLDSLDPRWTIIITSDHGAADSGTHGTDTREQRLSPFVAYGPGIPPELHPTHELDQAEIPGLMSALLGVANAAQSRASIPFEWLDESNANERTLACREVERLRAALPTPDADDAAASRTQAEECCASSTLDTCGPQARRLAAAYDREEAVSEGLLAPTHIGWLGAAIVAALAAAVVLAGWRCFRVVAFGSVWLALSLVLTYGVERLPGAWPNGVRGTVFAIANGALVTFCVAFRRWQPWLARHSSFVLSVMPGWLVVSYTPNTQVESYVVAILLAALLFVSSRSSSASGASTANTPNRAEFSKNSAILLISFAVLLLPGTRASDVTPAVLGRNPTAAALGASALLVVGLLVVLRSRALECADLNSRAVRTPLKPNSPTRQRVGRVENILSVGCVMLGYWLRHAPLSWLGRLLWVGLVVVAALTFIKHRVRLAFVLGVASTVIVARDFECVVLLACLFIAAAVGERASGPSPDPHSSSNRAPLRIWIHVTFLFTLSSLLWIALQGGLQLNAMDFAAGTFGDSHIPAVFIAACLVYKFTVSEVLLVGIYMGAIPNEDRSELGRGIILLHLARGVTLLLMLAFCGQSYWTAFRVLGDLPFALGGVFGVVVIFSYQSLTRNHALEAT